MEQELKIEDFYNEPYRKIHKQKRIRLLNNKQKTILAYMMAGTTVFIVGLSVISIVNLFS